jgi:hypothetical protein
MNPQHLGLESSGFSPTPLFLNILFIIHVGLTFTMMPIPCITLKMHETILTQPQKHDLFLSFCLMEICLTFPSPQINLDLK